MFQKGDFLVKFDLKSGYHHDDIYKPHPGLEQPLNKWSGI